MDAREMMDLCLYREAEIALTGKHVKVLDDAPTRPGAFVKCEDCGTWSAGHERECPYCFTKWGA